MLSFMSHKVNINTSTLYKVDWKKKKTLLDLNLEWMKCFCDHSSNFLLDFDVSSFYDLL